MENRGSRITLKKKQIKKQIVDRGDVGHRLQIYFTEHNPVRCTEHLI